MSESRGSSDNGSVIVGAMCAMLMSSISFRFSLPIFHMKVLKFRYLLFELPICVFLFLLLFVMSMTVCSSIRLFFSQAAS